MAHGRRHDGTDGDAAHPQRRCPPDAVSALQPRTGRPTARPARRGGRATRAREAGAGGGVAGCARAEVARGGHRLAQRRRGIPAYPASCPTPTPRPPAVSGGRRGRGPPDASPRGRTACWPGSPRRPGAPAGCSRGAIRTASLPSSGTRAIAVSVCVPSRLEGDWSSGGRAVGQLPIGTCHRKGTHGLSHVQEGVRKRRTRRTQAREAQGLLPTPRAPASLQGPCSPGLRPLPREVTCQVAHVRGKQPGWT